MPSYPDRVNPPTSLTNSMKNVSLNNKDDKSNYNDQNSNLNSGRSGGGHGQNRR